MAQTHFGYQTVDEHDKASRVRGVFDSVAKRYDVMNDVMSMGLHRAWKAYTVAVADVRPGQSVLDIAGGTGDLARAVARKVDEGLALPTTVCDAERLPFKTGTFDLVSVAFGLRNMTHKDVALAEMCRVLRPGGRLLVLEFSKVAQPLRKPYDWYSLNVLPLMGKLIANDGDSYRYLAESIRMHPDQAELKAMMKTAGFGHVDVHNLTAGVVALHAGIKC
ncbi:MAG: bifunctional demethylmenaquinone methyltransferase/2-methoxy-6-polyprenyl-1,4-benzoquinol methylase [Burkholderiales bacterium PBB5]|nr:MAG: bifunctional demethylmenaquinone methyltransferase/2-methoxy-6-polyprenyl-1,4-benzoquinol methylase [Burkholderiales bacterium PBB5]